MPKKSLKNATVTLLGLAFPLLVSCGHAKIKDWEDYADIGQDGAIVFHELSDGERDVPKNIWDSLDPNQPDARFGMLCMTPESFAAKKAAIETLCQNSQLCDYETKTAMTQFFLRMDALIKRIHEAKARQSIGQ